MSSRAESEFAIRREFAMIPLPPSLEKKLKRSVTEHNLAHHYDVIRDVARLTFLLRVEVCENQDRLALGGSRFGGTPDLPAGWAWPRAEEKRQYGQDEPQLLGFIGQINFAEIPSFGQALPSKGILYVFAYQEEAVNTRHTLLFSGENAQLTRRPMPDLRLFVDEYIPKYGVLRINAFSPSISLPDDLDRMPAIPDAGYDSYSELVLKLHQDSDQREPSSRLLGYPFTPYEDLLPNSDWQLLLEVQSFFDASGNVMNFWDAGCLQIIAPSANIARGDFATSKAAIESG